MLLLKIVVAGAGAGKTTSMADEIASRLMQVEKGKIIYVLTFTNSARDMIRNKLIESNNEIPSNVKVETYHTFLLQEVIYPFHHLLFEKKLTSASIIKLPKVHSYKNSRIKELKLENIIHVEKVTETAKWIISGKNKDKKKQKDIRKQILSFICSYLDSIFVDEAQDIDSDFGITLEKLSDEGININLIGDPKQDLRGRDVFKSLVKKYPIKYSSINYRCPQNHVSLSNVFTCDAEKQVANKNVDGKLEFLFENDIDMADFIRLKKFDYVYISEKNNRFFTGKTDKEDARENLKYEVKRILKTYRSDIEHMEREIFSIMQFIEGNIGRLKSDEIVKRIFQRNRIYDTTAFARLCSSINGITELDEKNGISVSSIDKVKGLDGDHCMFVLNTALSDYLFEKKKDENKTKNYLYVALTRSKSELTILVTKEVEIKYGRVFIQNKLNQLGMTYHNEYLIE